MSDYKVSKIIDVHAHIYPTKIAGKAVSAIGRFYDLTMTGGGTSEGLIASGAKIGVTRYVVHSAATTPEQVHSINSHIIRECEAHCDLFTGFGTLHPDMKDFDSEIEFMMLSGLKGIKLHPDFQKFSINAPELMPMYRAVGGRLPILFHTGDKRYLFSNPWRVAEIKSKFPELRIIAAHFGGYSEWKDAARELYSLPIMFDTSSSLFALDPREATDMIRAAGVEKFMFGSDFPMWDHEGEFARFMRLGLTDDERDRILFKNAERFLQL